jgi:hypothetical protein
MCWFSIHPFSTSSYPHQFLINYQLGKGESGEIYDVQFNNNINLLIETSDRKPQYDIYVHKVNLRFKMNYSI